MVLPVGADHVGEHLGVTGIGLGARTAVAFPIAGHRLGVDRVHLIAGADQRRHPQPAIGFDPDHHLGGILDQLADQLVEAGDPGHPLRQTAAGQAPTLLPSPSMS